MRLWDCSRCEGTAATDDMQAGTPTHVCSGAFGMTIPFAPMGVRSKVELTERADYVGGEDVQRDSEGRVWMSATVTTDNTEAVAVYAPTAYAGGEQ